MDSGSYQIYIYQKKDCEIEIGRLGNILFKKGYYVYTGSAMRNLGKRIERHKRNEKKLHWHIDYLLSDTNSKIIKIDIFPSEDREECERNLGILANFEGVEFIKGFGSSDCRKCDSHLVYIGKYITPNC